MSYYFQGTTAELMADTLHDLQKSAEQGPGAEGYFRRALAGLVGVYDRQGQTGSVDAERLKQFRREVYERLLGFLDDLSVYVPLAILRAEDANDNEWYELCMRRSVIQVLLDDYAGTPIAEAIDPADVAELDVELRRVGLEQGPVPKERVPEGLPESHWWWQYPKTTEPRP